MEYTIRYYNNAVQNDILSLPATLAARYVVLTRRMVAVGSNLGEPHTKAMGNGLFEMRLKGAGHREGFLLHSDWQADRNAAQFCQEIRSHAPA